MKNYAYFEMFTNQLLCIQLSSKDLCLKFIFVKIKWRQLRQLRGCEAVSIQQLVRKNLFHQILYQTVSKCNWFFKKFLFLWQVTVYIYVSASIVIVQKDYHIMPHEQLQQKAKVFLAPDLHADLWIILCFSFWIYQTTRRHLTEKKK